MSFISNAVEIKLQKKNIESLDIFYREIKILEFAAQVSNAYCQHFNN